MDLQSLERALDLENCHESILEETRESVRANVASAICNLVSSEKVITKMLRSLQAYRFVSDLDSLEYGSYVRWLKPNTRDDMFSLTNGGHIIEIKIEDRGPVIVCRQQTGRIFQFIFNETLVFKKLTSQEIIILQALQYAADV